MASEQVPPEQARPEHGHVDGDPPDRVTVLVTGSTAGIGFATAEQLLAAGADVGIVGRDEARGRRAQEALAAGVRSGQRVELFLADQSSQAENRRLADEVRERLPELRVLINNVGGLYTDRWETVDGIEGTLAVSHLAPFLLTHLLLPTLQANGPARIVNVSSGAVAFGRIEREASAPYVGMRAYADAKLADLLTTLELASRLDPAVVTVNAVDPGWADTDMTRGMSARTMPWPMRVFAPAMSVLARLGPTGTPEQAARTSVYVATAPELAGVTGGYYRKSAPTTLARRSRDAAARAAAWRRSLELTGLDDVLPEGRREAVS